MKIHDLIQGSPEWHAHRAQHRNAGDAAAAMSCSPHESRNALLKRTYLDMKKDVSDFVQAKVFDPGHRFEALARPIAEKIVGEDLYAVVGVLEGTLMSASFDGLPMDESFPWEHKRLNAELREAFQSIAEGELPRSALPMHHRIQMEHQMVVCGADRALFMASEFDDDGKLVEEHHCWCESDPELRQKMLDAWAQFEMDLQTYELPAATGPAAVGKTPGTLPALRIEVTGQVTASNLAEFKQTALGAIRAVNRDLRTDQDFADAEKAVKWCSDVESRLKAAKEHALSQTASIDALFKALDDISAEARTVRLDLDKLVARRKTEVKEEAVAKARRALDEHIATLHAEIAPFRLPTIAADFAGCIKGLKSIASMQDKLDGLLVTTKIAAEAEARVVREHAAMFADHAQGYEFLFPDLAQLIHRTDFLALVQGRIAQRKLDEAERERKKREAEELARQQAEARRLTAEAEAAAQIRAAQEAASRAADVAAVAAAQPVNVSGPERLAPKPADGLAFDSRGVLSPIPQPRADEPATLKLGDINARLLPMRIDAAGLSAFGINPARTEGAAKLYRESDFARLVRSLIRHLESVMEVPA